MATETRQQQERHASDQPVARTSARDWSPAIEAFQRGQEFIVHVDAPGVRRRDVEVEVGDDALTIHGERRQDRQEERDGMFWTERSYGSFTRTIPLPAGV